MKKYTVIVSAILAVMLISCATSSKESPDQRAIAAGVKAWNDLAEVEVCGTASFCLLKNAPPSLPKKRLSQPPPLPPPQNGYKKAAIVGGRKDTYGHKICQNRCENHREHR